MLWLSWDDDDDDEELCFQNYVRDCTCIGAKRASPQVIRIGKCLGSGQSCLECNPLHLPLSFVCVAPSFYPQAPSHTNPSPLGVRQWHGTPTVCVGTHHMEQSRLFCDHAKITAASM